MVLLPKGVEFCCAFGCWLKMPLELPVNGVG